jgi:flagellar FliL protein
MSDEMSDVGAMEGGDSMGVDQGKKSGPLPELVVLILKIVAAAIGMIILTAIVAVIVYQFMNADTVQATRVDISQNYETKPPILSWYDGLGEIRAQTKDTPARSIIIDVQLGYTLGEEKMTTELINQRSRLIDLIRRYLSQQRNEDLQNEEELKQALKTKINQILREGQIEEVIFHQFQTFEF